MRIWILNSYATPPDQAAGTRHYDIGCVIVKKGYDVTISQVASAIVLVGKSVLYRNERMRVECIDGVRFAWIVQHRIHETTLAGL